MKINFIHFIHYNKNKKTLPTKKNKNIFTFSYQETALRSQEKMRNCSSEHIIAKKVFLQGYKVLKFVTNNYE